MTAPATHPARPQIARAIMLGLTMALAAGCAAGPSPGQSSDNFEIRAMIASDREAMHAMDERMRRIEDQIQELAHGGVAQPGNAEAVRIPARPEVTPAPASPPAAAAPPPGASIPLGAPPAPEAASGGDSGPSAASGAPGGEPVAEAPPASPVPGAAGESETTTIASAGEPAPVAATPPSSGDENARDSGNAENGTPAGDSAEGGAPAPAAGTAETGNPEERPPESAAPPATGDEGEAPTAAAAPHGGEEVASAPAASVPENAPAATAPRWPQDLSQELQSPANAKGGAGKLYRSGLDAMKSRDYSAAVERFGMIQKKYPHSDLTEPAAYFSANALNEMGKYDQAILQYNDLVMRYPKGKYSSEALLREGQAFMQINDKIDARLTLQKLVNEHGGTPQGAEASAMLKNLESNQVP